eukprot:CAMPEP_0114599508 /NCGR_PEP_ID=MMETSP0125-20121206/22038_1 /TAXON_ID=485358 ORGANISM="Aristerostoma sp., Strain ATCC 50986" /NCGR_SAMPLE_ID=MMETSP0125 /ASSEMBLY_ACC=CAM_ASM_000245 /LENGTH=177 /DNA_ID=CAMNT_0001806629 /DNA_START=670 /DNA_END=1203 /DNA_ORIENTATION=-
MRNENTNVKKSLAHEGGDGLYKPDKIRKKADIMKAQKDLESKDDLTRQKLEEAFLVYLMSAVENTKGIDKLLDKEKLKGGKKSPLEKLRKKSDKLNRSVTMKGETGSRKGDESVKSTDSNKTTKEQSAENLINFVKASGSENHEDLVKILRSPKHQLSKFSTTTSPAGQSQFSNAFA